jgi:hypothetical protein
MAEWKAKHGLDKVPDDASVEEKRMAVEENLNTGTSYCFSCGDEFPIKEMRLVTRLQDPYAQTWEGESDYIPETHRHRMCKKCFDERYDS